MKPTEEVYGKQSFARLRSLNCFAVYHCHINMLQDHKQWLMDNPPTYDIYTRMGYVDYNALKKVNDDIAHFEGLIKQAKDNL